VDESAHPVSAEDLVALAFDELDARSAAAIADHVALCPACRREVDELRGLRALLGLAASDRPPARAMLRVRALWRQPVPAWQRWFRLPAGPRAQAFLSLAQAAAFAVLALSLALYPAVARAAEAMLPGDPLYPMKTVVEQLQVVTTFNPDARAELQVTLVQVRVQEIVALVGDGRYEDVANSVDGFRNEIDNTVVAFRTVANQNRARGQSLAQQVQNYLTDSAKVLDHLGGASPAAAQPIIQEAADVSRAGAHVVVQLSGVEEAAEVAANEPEPVPPTMPWPTVTWLPSPASAWSATPTASSTATPLPSMTATRLPTTTPRPPTATPTATETGTPTQPPTRTPSLTPTETDSPTPWPTFTPTPTKTPTEVPPPTETATLEPTAAPTETPTEEPPATQTPTETAAPTTTPTEVPTETQTPTETPGATETPTDTLTPTLEPPTATVTPTFTPTMTLTATATDILPTPMPTATPGPTKTEPPAPETSTGISRPRDLVAIPTVLRRAVRSGMDGPCELVDRCDQRSARGPARL
jgi:hypothetical protein